jgi:hypothetical protein
MESNALKRFELENNIEDEKLYQVDDQSLQQLLYSNLPANEKPWRKNQLHF